MRLWGLGVATWAARQGGAGERGGRARVTLWKGRFSGGRRKR